MSKRTRTFVFLFLVVVFVLLTPALLLYSQGYRVDWDERNLSQVGAFYFSVTPTRSEVVVNEKSIGKTARLLGTTLTKNFAPGIYHVRIQKQGYHAWEKRLEVVPRQVTEAKRIALFPLQPVFTPRQSEVLAFWFAPNATEALLQKSNSQSAWSLVLWDTRRNVEYLLYETSPPADEISNVEWTSDSSSFAFSVDSPEQRNRYSQRIDRSALAGQTTAAEQLRAAAQARTPYVPHPLSREAAAFLEKEQEVFWLDQAGVLWRKPNRESQAVQINQKPVSIEAGTPYAIFVFGNEFFIQAEETLYRYNSQTQAFEQFFTPFQDMAQSPDGGALALSSDKEIWLYFLRDDLEQPPRSRGEKIFLTRFSEDIANLAWLTSHHLLFTRANTIVISEIDTRDRPNMVDLAKFPAPTLFWQGATQTLFVHTSGQIHAAEQLLP